MILNLMGIIGLGIVWGWYLGTFTGRVHHLSFTVPALFSASLAVSAYLFWSSRISGLTLLAISVLVAMIIHMLWRRELQKRYGQIRPDYPEVLL